MMYEGLVFIRWWCMKAMVLDAWRWWCMKAMVYEGDGVWRRWCMKVMVLDAWRQWCMKAMVYEGDGAWRRWCLMHEDDGVWRRWCMKATVHEGIFIGFFNLKTLTILQPSYFDQHLQPRGLLQPPWILILPTKFFCEIIRGWFFGVKESNGDS